MNKLLELVPSSARGWSATAVTFATLTLLGYATAYSTLGSATSGGSFNWLFECDGAQCTSSTSPTVSHRLRSDSRAPSPQSVSVEHWNLACAEGAVRLRVGEFSPQVDKEQEFTVSQCCHLLRLHDLGPTGDPTIPSGAVALRILTDSRLSSFGQAVLFETRNGVRYRLAKYDANENLSVGEAHRDLCLATFAELRLPVSTPLVTPTGHFTVQNLLEDSVSNFHLGQKELTWTATAYALYLPPTVSWTNRFGEHFTFDSLVDELCSRRLVDSSCGGTHILYALAILLQADRVENVLSESARARLQSFLIDCVGSVSSSQFPDGSWDLAWHPSTGALMSRTDPELEFVKKLVATGHLTEWIQQLPIEMRPSREVYRRALTWLHDSFSVVSSASRRDPARFCPATHALCALKEAGLARTEILENFAIPNF